MWPFQKIKQVPTTPFQYLSDSYKELAYGVAKREVLRHQGDHEISWYVRSVRYELEKLGIRLSHADCAVLIHQAKQDFSR